VLLESNEFIYSVNQLTCHTLDYVASYFFYLWLCSPCGPWPLFQFLNLYTVGRTLWMGDQPIARTLPTQNKCTQTSMPQVGFEPMIPLFEWAKIVRALDCTTTVISQVASCISYIYKLVSSLHIVISGTHITICVLHRMWRHSEAATRHNPVPELPIGLPK
jgi:hypothetical protein